MKSQLAAHILDTTCIGDAQTKRVAEAISVVLRERSKLRVGIRVAIDRLQRSDPPTEGATTADIKYLQRLLA